MTENSNLKINERSNLEQPNLRVIRIENKNWEDKAFEINLYQRANMRISKIASYAGFRMNKTF